MTIICDASSLILLAKVNLLSAFVERNEAIVPEVVYKEVVRGEDKGRKDSLVTKKLVAEKKITIKAPDKKTKEKIKELFNLQQGELEVITLGVKEKSVILTDDKKCINAAKALELEFITSLDVITALCKKGGISKKNALECISRLNEYGWYSKNLIKSYQEALK